ncbi:TRM11 family methyltransferase [Halobacteriovorax sp. HLS]|uniref:TRM11 family SAM-dependent methyltransferase n=1 Tax=Halobacteriovorax sp. HLS TaxID=2234000 RepID=UPI000FDBC057|nr:hypothetical protein [Halobacteriovorax sp. HLS]
MKKISLLISPEIKSAYFAQYTECALAELQFCFPGLEARLNSIGLLDFIDIEVDQETLEEISYMSFFHGAFEQIDGTLKPLDLKAQFSLHDNFIFGSKFKGKTNERFTQLMINLGKASINNKENIKVLDPMCGRATTLLWCLRYGIISKGIELDPRAIMDVTQIVKKWSKICSIRTTIKDGFVGKKNKLGLGKFIEVSHEKNHFKMISGNSANCSELLSSERFDLIITDIPYGIQHRTDNGLNNPFDAIDISLAQWKKCLKKDGSIVIGYNSNNPKRDVVIELAQKHSMLALEFNIAHRMSESIVRDVIILKHAQQ